MLSRVGIARRSQSTILLRSVRLTNPPAGNPCSRACRMYSPPGVSRSNQARYTASSMKNPSGCAIGSVALLPALRRRVAALFGSVVEEESRTCVAEDSDPAEEPVEVTGVISYLELIAARRASSGSVVVMLWKLKKRLHVSIFSSCFTRTQ